MRNPECTEQFFRENCKSGDFHVHFIFARNGFCEDCREFPGAQGLKSQSASGIATQIASNLLRSSRNKLPFMILNPQEWTAEKWVPLKNAFSHRKMHFPTEKCIFLQSARKMQFPAEKCTFLQKHAVFWGAHGRKPQEGFGESSRATRLGATRLRASERGISKILKKPSENPSENPSLSEISLSEARGPVAPIVLPLKLSPKGFRAQESRALPNFHKMGARQGIAQKGVQWKAAARNG